MALGGVARQRGDLLELLVARERGGRGRHPVLLLGAARQGREQVEDRLGGDPPGLRVGQRDGDERARERVADAVQPGHEDLRGAPVGQPAIRELGEVERVIAGGAQLAQQRRGVAPRCGDAVVLAAR